MKKYSRKEYEQYLNDISSDLPEESFTIGGKFYVPDNNYGTLLRKHDPVSFSVGYAEERRKYE